MLDDEEAQQRDQANAGLGEEGEDVGAGGGG